MPGCERGVARPEQGDASLASEAKYSALKPASAVKSTDNPARAWRERHTTVTQISAPALSHIISSASGEGVTAAGITRTRVECTPEVDRQQRRA